MQAQETLPLTKKDFPLTFLCFRAFFGQAITVIHDKDKNIMENILFNPCLLGTFLSWNVVVVFESFIFFNLKNTPFETLGRTHHQILNHLKWFCKKEI